MTYSTESNSISAKQGYKVSLLGLRLLQNGIMEDVAASRTKFIPGEIRTVPPQSSARSLLKHAGKWAGGDLEKCIKKVYEARGEVDF